MKRYGYKRLGVLLLVSLLSVSTFALGDAGNLTRANESHFKLATVRIVRTAQVIYDVEHYITTSEYPALETPDWLAIGGSTLLRESADEARTHGGRYTLGVISCITDDGGGTAMIIAALDMFYRVTLFALGDVINNWVGFANPIKQRLLEVRFGDFKKKLGDELKSAGIEPTERFLKLASKSFSFSQRKEDVFLEGLPNGLSKGILRAIEEEGLSDRETEIVEISLRVFDEMKNLTLVEKTRLAFEEIERAVEAEELTNPLAEDLPGDWDNFKQKMLDLARVVDEQFVEKGILSPEGQSLRNLIFVGAMYVSGYLREGRIDESKFEDSLRIIGNVFGVTDLGFAAPAAHGQDVVLVARMENDDVITTQTDISRFDESEPVRWPIHRMELWMKKRDASGEVIYGDEITYDGDVKPEIKEGGRLVAADWVIERIKNTNEAIYLPCGSAFTSIAPVLMTDGIPQALAEKKAEGVPVILTLKPHQDSETVGLAIVQILKVLERSMQYATGTDLKLEDVISHVVVFKPDVALSDDILTELSVGIPEFRDRSMHFDPDRGKAMFGEKTLRGLTAVVNKDNPQRDRLLEIGAQDIDTFEKELAELFPGVLPVYIGSEIASGVNSRDGDIRVFWPGEDWLDYPAGYGIHGAEEFRFRFAPWTIRDIIERILLSSVSS